MIRDDGLKGVYQTMFNSFAQPNARTEGIRKMLGDIYPALRDKLFKSNNVMMKLISSEISPMDVLDYKICGRCESIAPPSDDIIRDGKVIPTCTCFTCGTTTQNPPTVSEWIKYQIKHKAPLNAQMELEAVSDMIAYHNVYMAKMEVKREMERRQGMRSEQMGILMPDGTVHVPEEHKKEKAPVKMLSQEEMERKQRERTNYVNLED